MGTWHHDLLDREQGAFVESHVPTPELIENLSWQDGLSRVLHIRAGGSDLIVKAAPPSHRHIRREIQAHRRWTGPLLRRGLTQRMQQADDQLNILILDHLPGELAQDTRHELDLGLHHQAGRALAEFHNQYSELDTRAEATANKRALGWLGRPHRIEATIVARVRELLSEAPTPPVVLVPTHGDWQPRNWLVHHGTLHVIDFGRFDLRPAATDLCRLAAQQWRGRDDLIGAFLDGYGTDPRDATWPYSMLREAVSTAAWAHQVDDLTFEAQGHRMLRDALMAFEA